MKKKKYGSVETAIGELHVFYLSVKDYQEIEGNLDSSIEEADEERYLNEFIKHSSFPSHSLDEEYKPKEPVLTDDEVSKLAASEIDKIIQLYIDNSPHLYKKQIRNSENDDEGNTRISYSYGEVEYPRNEDESLKAYLHRLVVLEEKKRREQQKKLTESIIGRSNFSHGLDKNIMSTLSLGESLSRFTDQIHSPLGDALKAYKSPLQDTIDRISKITSPTDSILKSIEPIQPIDSERNIQDMYKIERENRERPFRDLGEKLDELVELSSESTKFMVEMNKSQTQMANELKQSGDQASKHSKLNIYFSVVVIILTVIGLLISSSSIYISVNDKQTEGLSGSINKLTDSLQSLPSTNDLVRLEKLIQDQSTEIKQLKAENSAQREEIEQLKLNNKNQTKVQLVPNK